MSKIKESLISLFEQNRIILWYDEDQSFTQEFDTLELEGIEKIVVENNEFATKYRMYIQKPSSKFLLYLPYSRPENDDNWLLDIELSNYVFHTDQEAMTLQEIDLPIHYRPWIKQHLDFFKNKERVQKFNQLKEKTDDEKLLTFKLIQTVLGATTASIDELLKSYTAHFVNDKSDDIDKDLSKFGLFEPFWAEVANDFNYQTSNCGIYDFLLEVFQKSFLPLSGKVKVNHNAEVLLSNWKDLRSFETTFKELSKKIETDLNIVVLIKKLSLEELIQEDLFECIDQRIIKELIGLIENDSQSADKIEQILKIRELKFWNERYTPYYQALSYAIWLMEEVKQNNKITIADYNEGFKLYTTKWYQIDMYYRLFIQYYRETNQNGVLSSLYQLVHKIYSNTWLPNLSEKWQTVIDKNKDWYIGSQSQTKFFNRDVKSKYLDKGNKLFVIISDGFRYECGRVLHDLFNEEVRFTSELNYQVTNLPSYTQLGMASMLPHTDLSFGEGESVLIDGKSTQGIQSRQKILTDNSNVRAAAILAEELMSLSPKGNDAQTLIQNNDLIYVYHNRIDKMGDEKTTEDKVIEASKDEILFLMELVKKIANMNGNNIVITSDHGFVYQHQELLESDFTDAQIEGTVIKDSRRYVLGKNLTYNQNVLKFTSESLKIKSDIDILIPKGITRLRKQGSGSRYVHGGSTLQETVVPVLFIVKKRSDTVSKVEIDILNKANNKITTNIHTVKYYQLQAIGTKFIPRTIKSYFAVIDDVEENKQIISDVFNYTFDLTTDRTEEREIQNKFTLSTSIKRSSNVYLMVEEKVDKANKWITISKFPYTLSLSLENDFDGF